LEAVLFLAREPLGSRKLALLSGLADGTEARTLVRTLNRLYDKEGCAFRVVEVAGGFQVVSRAKFAPWLRRLQVVPMEVRLSVPALETLAVVAYRQPVLRADVEAIRGVQCGEILRQLMERGLVRIVGKSEDLGRPFLYGTTRQFLQIFGLRDLDQLPRPAWYHPEVAPAGERPACQPDELQDETTNQSVCSKYPGGISTVKTTIATNTVWEDDMVAPGVTVAQSDSRLVAGRDDLDDEEFEDDEDLDEDEDDDEDEDEDLEDEDFEDSDWEEVEDEDEGEEDLDEDEEFEDEEEDEDWDEEEDEDWDEEEDEDWDEEDDEEGEEEGEEDWDE